MVAARLGFRDDVAAIVARGLGVVRARRLRVVAGGATLHVFGADLASNRLRVGVIGARLLPGFRGSNRIVFDRLDAVIRVVDFAVDFFAIGVTFTSGFQNSIRTERRPRAIEGRYCLLADPVRQIAQVAKCFAEVGW